MINILYLIDAMNTGGTERQLYELIQGLNRDQFNVHLVILNPRGGLYYDKLDIPKFSLGFRSFVRPGLLANIAHLTRYIRQHDIHIVQSFFQDPTLLAALCRPFHRAKLIGSFRDLGFWRKSSETLKMRCAYPFYSGFIANSKAVKNQVVQLDGITENKIKVIYNGFDLCQMATVQCQTSEPPIVGIVANLNRPVKKVEDFVKAAALVHQKQPHVRFCVVGGGHLQPELERLAADLGLGDSIEFTGILEKPLIRISQWRVGVITSETEGFCNAIIEYMACGLPVVATNVGGNPELVTKENGFLVPVSDAQALADSVGKFLEDNSLCQKIREVSRDKILRSYSLDAMLAEYQAYYQELIR